MKISVQLLLPFIAGQIARRWIGAWVGRNKSWLKFVDQGSIPLVVYGAFSEAVIEGIWHQIPLWELAGLVVACCVLLVLVLLASTVLGKAFGFNRRTASPSCFVVRRRVATGVPMAQCCSPAAPSAC